MMGDMGSPHMANRLHSVSLVQGPSMQSPDPNQLHEALLKLEAPTETNYIFVMDDKEGVSELYDAPMFYT